jgi:formylglycine-generating enzyme required for sulfatase activity
LAGRDDDQAAFSSMVPVRVVSDIDQLSLRILTRPALAGEIGRDRHGLWAELKIGHKVSQRLRWIFPGRFRMGSPETEVGRFENEGPQREVRIERGFWIFATPCTQEFWEAVMGENPSRFRSPTRPVEQVSWDDCRNFLERLNGRLDGLVLSLPSEAQWEYACRAGTETATYAGNLEILGENNAPVLDEIAWYGGNCGVDFELENGWDTSGWKDKQHKFERGGTHPVGLKRPNAWGLHDMLGSVWEWCADEYREHGSGDVEASADRVLRGGSWYFGAWYVRAAVRHWRAPGSRLVTFGFRCAEFREGREQEQKQGRAGSESERRAEPRGDREPARPGAGPKRRRGRRKE